MMDDPWQSCDRALPSWVRWAGCSQGKMHWGDVALAVERRKLESRCSADANRRLLEYAEEGGVRRRGRIPVVEKQRLERRDCAKRDVSLLWDRKKVVARSRNGDERGRC